MESSNKSAVFHRSAFIRRNQLATRPNRFQEQIFKEGYQRNRFEGDRDFGSTQPFIVCIGHRQNPEVPIRRVTFKRLLLEVEGNGNSAPTAHASAKPSPAVRFPVDRRQFDRSPPIQAQGNETDIGPYPPSRSLGMR